MAKKYPITVMAILIWLLSANSLFAKGADSTVRKREFRAMLGAGILPPLDVNEIGGPNLQRKYSWSGRLGFGYAHKVYKNLSAGIAFGCNLYTYRYAADVVIDAQRIPGSDFDIRWTGRFYCFYLSLSLSHRFKLSDKLFVAEGGIKLIETPSLYLGHGATIQDSIGHTSRIFLAEADFNSETMPIYFFKAGTPLFKNTSKFWINIVFNYSPQPLGNGTFYIANTTRNSNGTFNINASGVGVELRYVF